MPMKAREYLDRINSMGFERATQWATIELIERHNILEKSLNESGTQLLEMVRVLDMISNGALVLRQKIEQMERSRKIDETHPVPADDRFDGSQ